MKLKFPTLTSESKTKIAGVLGILVPALLIREFASGDRADAIIIFSIGIASLVGYYEGGKRTEALLTNSGEKCSCGAKYHSYDCPEAQD